MTAGWKLVDEKGSWGELHYCAIKIPNTEVEKSGFQFYCFRTNDPVEAKIYPVYKNAVEGNAHFDIERGFLTEDSKSLNREKDPQVYRNFENQVILSLTESLKSPFELKLAIYNSGQLLGTEILLFRLVDYLKREKASGKIRLFLIDQAYQAIKNSGSSVNYISQFAKDICLALPSSIQVQCTFFCSHEDYLQKANQNPHFKHHLLIGPETAKGLEALNKGVNKAPIILSKNLKTCELKLPGNFTDYYREDNRVTAFQPIKQNPVNKESDDDSTRNLILGGGVVLCIAIGVGFLARRALNSTT